VVAREVVEKAAEDVGLPEELVCEHDERALAPLLPRETDPVRKRQVIHGGAGQTSALAQWAR
jgi:hypothetical protein